MIALRKRCRRSAGRWRTGKACVVTLRNYRKTGELFLNRLSIRPLVDREGTVIYYLGVQYDLSHPLGDAEEASARCASARALEGNYSGRMTVSAPRI
ncbi:PAS domain-containing protein [Candidatus Accumulibacter necessarius]|uniref:PAS domain-containing protein n=1 Tax=Candidatus Accumulibacter necessarius TaxID=2954386 RepID=UPI003DA90026